MMRVKKKIVQYVMLLAGILVLLSVVVPHHHHGNGMPCYQMLMTETTQDNHSSGEGHDCDCSGHNLVFNSSLELHATDGDALQYLFPLLVLFDYMYPPEIGFHGQLFGWERSVYMESLHDMWSTRAVGLRAPPQLV